MSKYSGSHRVLTNLVVLEQTLISIRGINMYNFSPTALKTGHNRDQVTTEIILDSNSVT